MNLFEAVGKKVSDYFTQKDQFGYELPDPKKDRIELKGVDHETEGGSYSMMSSEGGVISNCTNFAALPTSEAELIKTYRRLSILSDFDYVLNEIRNEVLVFDSPGKKAIDVSFSDSEENRLSTELMKKIKQEYDYIYQMMDFTNKGLDYFEKWYVDGRIFIHKLIDTKKPKEGIKKVVWIDSLKIRKVVEYPKPDENGIIDINDVKKYYIFSEIHDVFARETKTQTMKILIEDTIAYSDSGIYDANTNQALSHLWKSIVPYNNMKMMEEALLVYRVVRSPERRAFYIGVGNLSKPKAEAYIKNLMQKFRNKLVYDTSTGTLADKKNILSMTEDYWLPRRDDGKTTEIETLPGATNLGTTEDVDLFRNKFHQSTNIPASRFKEEVPFVFGRSAEITKDEYRFKKFLDRLRARFVFVLEDILKTQLILKKIIIDSDWDMIKDSLQWVYAEDNHFVQWKESEVLTSQLQSMQEMDQFVGRYFTKKYAIKTALKLSDEEADQMIEDAREEAKIDAKLQQELEGGDAGIGFTPEPRLPERAPPIRKSQEKPPAVKTDDREIEPERVEKTETKSVKKTTR